MTNSISTISVLNKPIEKKCKKCGLYFPATEEFFSSRKDGKFGFNAQCKGCIAVRAKKYYHKKSDKLCPRCGKPTIKGRKYCSQECRDRRSEIIREDGIVLKKCPKCKKLKVLNTDNYYPSNNSNSGFTTYCIPCQSEKHKVFSKKRYLSLTQEQKDEKKRIRNEYLKRNKEKVAYRRKRYDNSFIKKNSSVVLELSKYETVISSDDEYIQVKCTYCGTVFKPTNYQAKLRLEAIRGKNNTGGECRIYCSTNCKLACPTYRQHKYPKGFKPATSREVEPLIRQLCFERDNWTCQHCGVTSKDAQLHCHHIIGVVHSPMEQNDISNTITLCKACHKALHKKSGCRYQDYKCA